MTEKGAEEQVLAMERLRLTGGCATNNPYYKRSP